MQKPTVMHAKRLAQYYKCDAVMIIAIHTDKGQIAGASYGATKEICRHAGRWLDKVVADVERHGLEGAETAAGGHPCC